MKNITPLNNTPTIILVKELPVMNGGALSFGFGTGITGDIPTLRINVTFLGNVPTTKQQVKIATYESLYKIEGDGKIIEDEIYACCQQAVYAMRMFLQYDEIGRAIPEEYTLCPGKEAFEADLIDVAKMLNALGGKGKYPSPKS